MGLPGKESNIRGFSAINLLMIIDEASRVPDELYKALRPMLGVANGDLWLLESTVGQKRILSTTSWGIRRRACKFGFRVPVTEF